jgi:hypothetical protein
MRRKITGEIHVCRSATQLGPCEREADPIPENKSISKADTKAGIAEASHP